MRFAAGSLLCPVLLRARKLALAAISGKRRRLPDGKNVKLCCEGIANALRRVVERRVSLDREPVALFQDLVDLVDRPLAVTRRATGT